MGVNKIKISMAIFLIRINTMKRYLLSILVVLSFKVMAQENPAEFCDDNYFCTAKMRELTDAFVKGNAQFGQEPLTAFSGGCYHLSELYNSEHEHHGAFIFEHEGSDLYSKGSFFFFWEQDPFLGMSVPEVKNWFIERNAKPTKTVVTAEQVELQYLGTGSDYHYWFRNNKANDKIIMIAKQKSDSYLGMIFCELNRH
jgi:hypothetical protein